MVYIVTDFKEVTPPFLSMYHSLGTEDSAANRTDPLPS